MAPINGIAEYSALILTILTTLTALTALMIPMILTILKILTKLITCKDHLGSIQCLIYIHVDVYLFIPAISIIAIWESLSLTPKFLVQTTEI